MKLKNRGYVVAVAKTDKHTHTISNLHFNTIPNGLNYWVADPFPIEVNGELYIFGEMYEYTKLKGSIAYTKQTSKGFSKWKKIIEEPYHLSFPNVFYIGDILYMCPESNQSGQLYLYKCLEFPEKWVKDIVLCSEGNFNDTIFWKQNDMLYGFTCEWHSIYDHCLKVFKIKDGTLNFDNGKCNVLEKSMSRPAGKIFFDEKEKEFLMVSQICKPQYGSGLVFKRFVLNYPNYDEMEIDRIYPQDIKCNVNKTFDGVHTFNFSEHYLTIDILWSRFNVIEKTRRIIKRLLHV